MISSRAHRPAVLPLLAVGCVLLCGLLVLLTRPAPAGRAAAAEHRVEAAVGSFVVGPRWSRTGADAVLFYAGPDGRPVVGLAGAVVADAGYCAGLPTSQRGFAGFAPVVPGTDVAAATRAVAGAWASGISGRDPPPLVDATDRIAVPLPGAVRVRARLRAPATGDPCLARRVALDVVGYPVEAGVATLVVVRDLDPEGVDGREVDALVQSLRSRT